MSAVAADQRTKATLHVSGLDKAVTRELLHAAFIPFGDIVEVTLPRDEQSDQPHRGFAYIEYESPLDAAEAIDNMNDSELFSKTLRVTQAKANRDTNPNEGLGSTKALWEQEGWLKEHAVDEEDIRAVQAVNGGGIDPMEGVEREVGPARPPGA
ncbi:hypothetical protein SAICODRAFT_9623 [Saitoella complicata NRRL Y-17804]|uniref:RRM domain-containing protein n=1 Tax=Saitoella complicata (strain BCRC 22490 / CBS 7301 / JCM 7358 / NBRC 10748 / NRRL Y-17804) TaxID=698492 RepID=A0A0E9NR44_SAICN|nr:uncharacterized protein SAICODRAFT_9623 [Saitoella complicata NRRL Y-17804]ODQ50658.1 hypothetical protein SAICODRAFT_9623 [Saitoella complicata NRRL Y-17804]GAO52141.1 hypothetical protein G7K_6227-t1 [Saitoella complicata NRRL Y-17804]